MKSFTAIVAIALASAIPAFAQSVLDLPTCAQNAVLLAIGTSGCLATDFECICKNKGFVGGLINTIPTLCTVQETYLVSSFAVAFCGASGVTLDLPASIQSPSAGSPSTTSTVVRTTSTSVVTTTSASVSTSSLSTSSVSVTGFSNSTTTRATTTSLAALTTSSTSARATTTSTNGGAVQTAGLVGVLGAVFMGVLAL